MELEGALLGGRYRVVRAIARGGMGSVYEALDERMGRPVAVKVVLPELAYDATLLERFRREAMATAALAHPNIVQVTDYGAEPNGNAFLVMELLQGESLATWLSRGGAMPVTRAVGVCTQVCAALAAAHAAGIVHRDLKPGNVFLVPLAEGRDLVKVLDFGVAQLKRGPAYQRLTATGTVLGTPAFMPPEQARGEEVDARADVYGVGAILYSCLAGRKPFVGANPGELLQRVLSEPPPPLATLRSDVGPALWRAIEQSLAKDRDVRFASAGAFAASVTAAVAADASLGRGAGAPATPPRWGRWAVFALLAVGLALLSLGATFAVLHFSGAPNAHAATPPPTTVLPSRPPKRTAAALTGPLPSAPDASIPSATSEVVDPWREATGAPALPATLTGPWRCTYHTSAGAIAEQLDVVQDGNAATATYRGRYPTGVHYSGSWTGSVRGREADVRFRQADDSGHMQYRLADDGQSMSVSGANDDGTEPHFHGSCTRGSVAPRHDATDRAGEVIDPFR